MEQGKQMLSFKWMLLLVLAVTWWSACENNKIDKLESELTVDSMPDMHSFNNESFISDSAVVRMQIKAPELESYLDPKNPHSVYPAGINVRFFDNTQREEASLKAGYGMYTDKTKLFECKYNVEIINQEGSTLRTEHLFIDRENEQLRSDSLVTIVSHDGNSIAGKGGFQSNLDFTEYRFIDVDGTQGKKTTTTDDDGWQYAD